SWFGFFGLCFWRCLGFWFLGWFYILRFGNCVGIFAIFQQQGDGLINFHTFGASRHQNFAELSFIDRFDFHRRFIGLDFSQHLSGLHLIAFFFKPAGQLAFGHG